MKSVSIVEVKRPPRVLLGHSPFGVQTDRVRQFQLLHEALDGGRRLSVDRNREDLEPLRLVALVQPLHGGHLFLAGKTPGRPEVQEDDFPSKVPQSEGRRGEARHHEVVGSHRPTRPDEVQRLERIIRPAPCRQHQNQQEQEKGSAPNAARRPGGPGAPPGISGRAGTGHFSPPPAPRHPGGPRRSSRPAVPGRSRRYAYR